MNFFKTLSESTSFPMCYNLLPHFSPGDCDYKALVACTEEALADGRIRTFFIADHPLHDQGFSSLCLAEDIIAAGGEPVVSLALGFHDRHTVMTRLQEYYDAGVHHFLFVSGDYPAHASRRTEKPVFDIDSVQLLMHLDDFQVKDDIVKGCVVSPFKSYESEQVWQYEKLKRKISVGADFIVSQLGFDLRKYEELLMFCRTENLPVPLVANVFIIDMQAAQLIQARNIPGVKMPGPLLRAIHEEPAGSPATLERTAKILAVLKGVGFQGALLGSLTPDFSRIKQVLDESEEVQSAWEELVTELDDSVGAASKFYYFQKDPQSRLNSREPAPVALKHFPSPSYSFSYFIDWLVYVPQGPLFKLTGRFCRFSNDNKFWYGFLWLLEFLSKRPLYGCTMCGDCTLYACGFLCYQSGCPKKIVNGPCGGSIDGYCEVYPDKKRCFWVRVYHNMKGVRQHVSFVAPPIPARDNSMARTSSWINFFMGRDHRKMKFEA